MVHRDAERCRETHMVQNGPESHRETPTVHRDAERHRETCTVQRGLHWELVAPEPVKLATLILYKIYVPVSQKPWPVEKKTETHWNRKTSKMKNLCMVGPTDEKWVESPPHVNFI